MSLNLPRIAITCDFETVTDRRGAKAPRYILAEAYVNSVIQAGGEPYLLPHLREEQAERALEHFDGLLVSGGDFDVPPFFYGEECRPCLAGMREQRSLFERGLIRFALKRGLPILGVCGGMQLLNVAMGGSLYQDLSEREGSANHQQSQQKHLSHHLLNIEPDTLLHKIVGATIGANSTHHQAVKNLGDGVRAVAFAPDGVVEAIEVTSAEFTLGVQWHPEAMPEPEHQNIYRAFVKACS